MAKTADRVVSSAKPYVERALHDEEIRENLKKAYEAARGLLEMANKKGPARVARGLVDDKHIQKNLQTTVDELRQAVNRLQGRERKRRSGFELHGCSWKLSEVARRTERGWRRGGRRSRRRRVSCTGEV